MRNSLFFLNMLLLVFLTSCVSQQKYTDLEIAKNRLSQRLNETEAELDSYRNQSAKLQSQLTAEQEQRQQVATDLERSRQRYAELDATNRDLLARYDRILEQNRTTLAAAGDENASLNARLNEKEQELNQRQKELQGLQQQLSDEEENQQRLQQELVAREARVAELEKAIADKEARLRTIRDRVNQALLGFSEADLTVREKNGKVYVSLSQNLLFASGSKTINNQGKQAIAQLATVLKANKDINITVEGHTDTDGEAAFNWDLSVGRATTVVKELAINGVAAERIIAAGRGEFYPIATNDTAAGKAQNRRTEIILTPKLEGLYELIGE
ncbi:OmpA family protein [Lewinella cohaerens]|uniref:OmpA family protein n=1 Tax=Lewinella cohaerens TaxID=70995 RepID=UPI00037FAB7A|nr:OmpA family protein [Lewinella cohaerens]